MGRLLERFGLWIQATWLSVTGVDCGCSKRRDALNEKYPYKKKD